MHSISFALLDHSGQPFDVVGFQSREALGAPYAFDILLLPKDSPCDLASILSSRAKLSWKWGEGLEDRLVRHGILSKASWVQDGGGGALLKVQLVPRIWRLSRERAWRIYTDMNLHDILLQLLGKVMDKSRLDLSELDSCDLALAKTSRFQYDESDLDFLQRHCEHLGLTYWFHHDEKDDAEYIHFSDGRPRNLFTPKVRLVNDSGLVRGSEQLLWSLERESEPLPASLAYQALNRLQPSASWRETIPLGGPSGPRCAQGEACDNAEEAKALAGLRAQATRCAAHRVRGEGFLPRLCPGDWVALPADAGRSPNSTFIAQALELRHSASRSGDGPGDWMASSRLEAYDWEAADKTPFRPPLQTPRPSIRGFLHGTVACASSEVSSPSAFALPDEHGRYKVLLSLNDGGDPSSPARQTCALPQLQPFGGPAQGLAFPLRDGTDVLVMALEGDPDQLVIAGALPTQDNPAVVTQDNRNQALVRMGEREELAFRCPAGSTQLSLGAVSDGPTSGGIAARTIGDYEETILGSSTRLVGGSEARMAVVSYTQSVAGLRQDLTTGSALRSTFGPDTAMTLAGDRNRSGPGMNTSLFNRQQIVALDCLRLAARPPLSARTQAHTAWVGLSAGHLAHALAFPQIASLLGYAHLSRPQASFPAWHLVHQLLPQAGALAGSWMTGDCTGMKPAATVLPALMGANGAGDARNMLEKIVHPNARNYAASELWLSGARAFLRGKDVSILTSDPRGGITIGGYSPVSMPPDVPSEIEGCSLTHTIEMQAKNLQVGATFPTGDPEPWDKEEEAYWRRVGAFIGNDPPKPLPLLYPINLILAGELITLGHASTPESQASRLLLAAKKQINIGASEAVPPAELYLLGRTMHLGATAEKKGLPAAQVHLQGREIHLGSPDTLAPTKRTESFTLEADELHLGCRKESAEDLNKWTRKSSLVGQEVSVLARDLKLGAGKLTLSTRNDQGGNGPGVITITKDGFLRLA